MGHKPASPHPVYVNLTDAVTMGYGAYSTLRSRIADGRLPAAKVAGRVKVRLADLDALASPIGQALGATDAFDAAVERALASLPPLSADERAHAATTLQRAADRVAGGAR